MKLFRKKEAPKLLITKSRANNGRLEWTEAKFNLTEYKRIKPMIDRWFERN